MVRMMSYDKTVKPATVEDRSHAINSEDIVLLTGQEPCIKCMTDFDSQACDIGHFSVTTELLVDTTSNEENRAAVIVFKYSYHDI